jgi:hypothetical protein
VREAFNQVGAREVIAQCRVVFRMFRQKFITLDRFATIHARKKISKDQWQAIGITMVDFVTHE